MDYYIKLSEAIAVIDNMGRLRPSWEIKQELQKIPASDVKEVKHGMWIVKGDAQPMSKDLLYGCSLCNDAGKRYYSWQCDSIKYCPNCGGIMDEEFEVL